jgi:hypothetical protein
MILPAEITPNESCSFPCTEKTTTETITVFVIRMEANRRSSVCGKLSFQALWCAADAMSFHRAGRFGESPHCIRLDFLTLVFMLIFSLFPEHQVRRPVWILDILSPEIPLAALTEEEVKELEPSSTRIGLFIYWVQWGSE